MTIEVYLNIEESLIKFDYKKIVKTLEEAIENRFKDNKCCSLIIVNNEEIHKINREYRGIDRPTDVISFEEKDNSIDGEEDNDYLGDIFISIDKVYEQAKLYGHSDEREMAFLLCHGLLHIRGYDHMNEEDEKEMFALQDEILNNTEYKR